MLSNTIRLKPFTLDKQDYIAHVPMDNIFAMTISPFRSVQDSALKDYKPVRLPADYRVWAIVTRSLIRDMQRDSRIVRAEDSLWLQLAKQNVLFKAITQMVSTQHPTALPRAS